MCLYVCVSVCVFQMPRCGCTDEVHAHGAPTITPSSCSHAYAKHTPSQICMFLIPATLLRLLLHSSPCLSGVIVSILLHQGAPEGYKLNINVNALSHCPPLTPSSPSRSLSVSHTHTLFAIQNRSVCLRINGEQ